MWYLLTVILVALNLADYFLTARLMQFGDVEIESNPVARFVCENLGLVGMLTFKLSTVAVTIAVMHIVRIKRPGTAWRMQLGFCGLMLAVVAYNSWLVRACEGSLSQFM
jgi:Domain of unknown function (DUF5658)